MRTRGRVRVATAVMAALAAAGSPPAAGTFIAFGETCATVVEAGEVRGDEVDIAMVLGEPTATHRAGDRLSVTAFGAAAYVGAIYPGQTLSLEWHHKDGMTAGGAYSEDSWQIRAVGGSCGAAASGWIPGTTGGPPRVSIPAVPGLHRVGAPDAGDLVIPVPVDGEPLVLTEDGSNARRGGPRVSLWVAWAAGARAGDAPGPVADELLARTGGRVRGLAELSRSPRRVAGRRGVEGEADGRGIPGGNPVRLYFGAVPAGGGWVSVEGYCPPDVAGTWLPRFRAALGGVRELVTEAREGVLVPPGWRGARSRGRHPPVIEDDD